MTCQEALSLLYDIIDKEASQIDTEHVEAHLRKCHNCSFVYRVEKSVNELIREKLSHKEPTPQLEELKAKVLGQLDSIDGENDEPAETEQVRTRVESEPAFRLGRVLAIAASIVVIVGAVYYGNSCLSHQKLYRPLEKAHSQACQHLDEFQDASNTWSAQSRIAEQMAYDLKPTVEGFNLIGGHLEIIDGVQIAHFLYSRDGKIVSVFIAEAGAFQIPEELHETRVIRGDISFFDHNCRSCRLVYHRIGNAVVITATEERDVELLDFVPGHVTI